MYADLQTTLNACGLRTKRKNIDDEHIETHKTWCFFWHKSPPKNKLFENMIVDGSPILHTVDRFWANYYTILILN